MKKMIAFMLVSICMLSLVSCNQRNNNTEHIQSTEQNTEVSKPSENIEPTIKISEFSYSEDSKRYKEGEPGVKTSGFVNTSEFKINSAEDAIERAKLECISEWDTVVSDFDTETNIWRITFYTQFMLGGGESVYLDENGKTVLIVYAE